MKSLIIVDSFGFFFRNFYALPPLKSKSGFPTGLLTGFIRFVKTLHQENQDKLIIFCADSKGKSFRHEFYKDYKANRQEAPQDLLRQIPVALNWIEKMGFSLISKTGLEADDLIASIATNAKAQGIFTQIITHDKDLYQLIDDDKIVIYDYSKSKDLTSKDCYEKFGVRPENFVDFQSILGDASDNIPGVKGIGLKGAAQLINEFKTLDEIYANLDKISKKRTKDLLIESQDLARLSKRLVSLKTDVFKSFDFNLCPMPKDPLENIKQDLQSYQINSPLNNAPKPKNTDTFATTMLCKIDEILQVLRSNKSDYLAFDTETTSLDTKTAKLVGFSFAFDANQGYYVPVGHNYLGVKDQLEAKFLPQIFDEIFTKKVIGHNLKFDLGVLKTNLNISPKVHKDTMLMAWLIDPQNSVSMDNLAKRYLGFETIKFKSLVKKGEDFSSVELQIATKYASQDAVITLRLYEYLNALLDEAMQKILIDVEMPFINTLLDFEALGIEIDVEFLKHYDKELEEKIEKLKAEIHSLSGTNFNINSPLQLGEILFERLNLPTKRKTKTGYSTDEATLLALKSSHPIIPKLLEYREHFKLRSTYSAPILQRTKENKRIRTTFLQTGTSTGRLSSQDPNLQNIPSRSELGRKFRGAFVAQKGFSLVGFDYSQIELRLLAHFSGDKTLIDAFNNGGDVHLQTSAQIFGETNAKEYRSLAKSINFGLIYGMGSKKLAQEANISTKEAKEYIEKYFQSFSGVKNFLESQKEKIKTQGYAQTLLGRKRSFNFQETSPMLISAYEREAINTIFQGSAADLIKLSMNKIQAKISNQTDIYALLQIHDELIYEIKQERLESYKALIQTTMQEIWQLKVPLEVHVNVGARWSELK